MKWKALDAHLHDPEFLFGFLNFSHLSRHALEFYSDHLQSRSGPVIGARQWFKISLRLNSGCVSVVSNRPSSASVVMLLCSDHCVLALGVVLPLDLAMMSTNCI